MALFQLGYWGLTFPLASLTLSTQLIGQELDSFGFKVRGERERARLLLLSYVSDVFFSLGDIDNFHLYHGHSMGKSCTACQLVHHLPRAPNHITALPSLRPPLPVRPDERAYT
jgi:hypothetical protein